MPPFRAWRERLGLTQAHAAKILGISKRTAEGYDKLMELSIIVSLACQQLELERDANKLNYADLSGLVFYPPEEEK
jgi:predicted transcriptional regulator